MNSKVLFLFVLLLTLRVGFATHNAVASDVFDLGEIYFETIGSDEKIPSGIVTAIVQDHAGFMWIGTQGGLVRFDGYKYIKYLHQPNNKNSLSSDNIRTLWAGHDGRIWIGTRSTGTTVFDPKSNRFTRYVHKVNDSNSLSENRTNIIIGDSQGGIWIGTNHGLNFIPPDSQQVLRIFSNSSTRNSLNHNYIRSLLIDKDNVLWIGTNGINTIDLTQFYSAKNYAVGAKLIKPVYSNNDDPLSLAKLEIRSLLQSTNGSIWFGNKFSGAGRITADGTIQRLKYNKNKLSKLASNEINHPWVTSILEVAPGKIWLGTFGGGIIEVDDDSGEVTHRYTSDSSVPSSLTMDQIGTMTKDDSGLVWIGTWGGGLNRYNPQGAAFRLLHHSLKKPNTLSQSDILTIRQITDSKKSNKHSGQFWIGTRNNGIDIVDPKIGVIKSIRANPEIKGSLKGNQIRRIIQTENGSIWVATMQSGIYRYDQNSEQFRYFGMEHGLNSSSILSMKATSDDSLWVGTSAGLNRLDLLSGQIEKFYERGKKDKPFIDQIEDFVVYDDGTVWLASDGGLLVRMAGEKYFDRILHHTGEGELSHNFVIGLLITRTGDLWVSTDQGVDRLISWDGKRARFESITKIVGAEGDFVWSNLLEADEQLFFGGSGLIDYKNENFYVYSKAEGVDYGVNWYGAYHKSFSGTLLYGGTRGLLMIKPKLFTPWKYHPAVVMSSLRIDGEIYPSYLLENIDISPKTKGFTLEFAALDYSDPEKNQYAYKLEGYDDDWTQVNSEYRQVSYTNLDPGTYRFKVKGSNRLGVWSNHELSIQVNVLPDWYQTWWFKTLLALLATTLLYMLYLFRVRQLKYREKVLRKDVLARTKELDILGEIGKELSSTLDFREIIQKLSSSIRQFIDAHIFAIGIYVPEDNLIRFDFALEGEQPLPLHSDCLTDKSKLSVRCVIENKEVIVFSRKELFEKNPDVIAYSLQKKMESYVYIPLTGRDNRTIGCLTLQSDKVNAFNNSQLEVIRTLASYTSIAIDNAEAYKKVKEHSKELEVQQIELENARDKAQRAVKEKSSFLANMSHEIRTPMHGILGMVGFVKATHLDSEQAEYINNIQLSAKTLLTVVNDIMDFSKVEAGKMELEEIPFALSHLLQNLKAVVTTLAKQKSLSLDIELPPDITADFVGDPVRINQVLLNLCSNAIKFTPHGGITIRISEEKIEKESSKRMICFNIIDQGIGISEDAILTLFDSFSQADSSTTRLYGGTGLGLAISKFLAKAMNGNIEVESKLGVGSSFKFTALLKTNDVIHGANIQEFSKQYNLLIVDEDNGFATFLSRKLTAMGANVCYCSDTDSGLQVLSDSTRSFDVVLLNWSDSGSVEAVKSNSLSMGYFEFVNLLNDHKFKGKSDLIVYSQYERTYIQKYCPQEIVVDAVRKFLLKPLSLVQLYDTIENLKNVSNESEYSNVPLSGLNILVAEDNQVNQLIVKKMLIKLGATIDLASNGKVAWELAGKNSYDLVLMDIHMPVMDGIEATEKILREPKSDKVQVIAMTANVVPSDVKYYLSIGMVDHLSKPFNRANLVEKILLHTNEK